MGVNRTRFKNVFAFILLTTSLIFGGCNEPDFKISTAKVEFISNIDNKPVFKWKMQSKSEGFIQSAVQIVIADTKNNGNLSTNTVWNSGKLETDNSQLKYKGNSLQNGKVYYAKIKTWNQNNVASDWSDAIRFVIPLDYPKDWKADWITYDYQPDLALPVFKKELDIPNMDKIESARLYIAAPGFYEAYLNGSKIGNNVLDPGQTNYEDYTYYTAYDLNLKTEQPNILGVMLGNGWYNQNVVWGKGLIYGQPVFIAQIVVKYKNGSEIVIGTDNTWMWEYGPVTFSNIYAGETYNANLELKDWFYAGAGKFNWKQAIKTSQHPEKLLEQFADPIQRIDSIVPKGTITNNHGHYIYDFGQNFSGWVKLKIQGEKGQEITLRCVEELNEEGDIDPRTTGVRATKVIQTLTYVCSGDGIEVWEPKFTYFGFRYVEVEGLATRPENDFLTGIVLYSSMPQSGSFTCSEENINKLHRLADWTLKSNMHGIPTDCPHREKCGWTGDAHALAQALIYNYDAQRFLSKYIFDMRSSGRNTKPELYFGDNFHDRSIKIKPKGIPTMIVPGKRTSGIASPDWGSAMTQLPWYLYMYYGDTTMLNNFYPDMKVWVDYIHNKNINGIITHGLGDWCPPGGNGNIECPVPVSSSAFHILDLKIMAQTSKVLGFDSDADMYNEMHIRAVESFNKHFLDTINFTYGSQTANAMALEIGITPDSIRTKVAASIVKDIHANHDGFISTGIFGLSRIFKALSDNGFEHEVYRLLNKKGENSFAFMWEHYDATTLWEVLPVYKLIGEEMAFRSHNHPMQAGYDSWFYSGIGGINPSENAPGFKKIIFKPYLTQQLKNATVSYQSAYGIIHSNWQKIEEQFIWKIQIPENSIGEIYVPNYKQNVKVKVNNVEVKLNNYLNNFSSIGDYGAGTYTVTVENNNEKN